MSTESKKSQETEGDKQMTGNGSKMPIFAGIGVLLVAGVIGMFLLTGNSSAEQKSGAQMASAAQGERETAAGAESAGEMIKLGNPVVATINGEEIKRSDVFNYIGTLPEQVRQLPIQQLFPLALEQVVNNQLIATKAQTANLEGDEEVETLLSEARTQIVRNVFIERELEKQVSQKKLLDAYKELLERIGEVEETKARHILVEEEEQARAIIAALDEGTDFVELARERSAGPSAESGGELGWFARGEMVAEFAEAAFAIAPGTHSSEPVQTQFGWHVIKVEDRRQRPEPDFELVKPQLEVQLRQQALGEMIAKWQKDAKIQKFDINGEPVSETRSN